MKKTLIIAAVSLSLFACKKESKEEAKTITTYYIKVVEVSIDNTTLTETPVATTKITE